MELGDGARSNRSNSSRFGGRVYKWLLAGRIDNDNRRWLCYVRASVCLCDVCARVDLWVKTGDWRRREWKTESMMSWCVILLCDCLYLWACGDHVVRVCFLIIIRFISFVFLNQIQSDFQIGSSETWSNHNLIVLAKMKPIGVGQ